MSSLSSGLLALTGAYAPSGAFSFEVYRRNQTGILAEPLGEYFPLIGPDKVSYGYRFSISAAATFGGASVSDLGNSISSLSVSGQIHAYFEGTPSRPNFNPFSASGVREAASLAGQTLLNSAFNSASVAGINSKTGTQDFGDLLWLFWHSRDGTRSRTRKPSSLPLLNDTNLLYIAMQAGPLPFDFERFQLVFNDYDSGKKLEVVLQQDGLQIEQSAEDAHTWKYNLSFHIIKDYSAGGFTFRPPLPSIRAIVGQVRTALDELAFSLSLTLSVAADIVRDVEDIKQERDFLKVTLDTFNEESESDIQTLRRVTGQAKKKNEKLRERIVRYYMAGRDPALAFLDPENDFRGLALDDTKRDADKFLRLLNLLETANNRASSESRTGRTEYVKPRADADSWERLSIQLYGDPGRAAELRSLNGVTAATRPPNEFERIKIPALAAGATTQQLTIDGILFERVGGEFDSSGVEISLFGTDLSLSRDGDLAAAPNGDLGQVAGIDSLVENTLDRIANYRGTVPMHGAWGLPFTPGDLTDDVLGRLEPARVAENIMEDPSVADATVTSISINGESLEIKVRVRPAGNGEEFTVEVSKPRWRASV